MNNFETTPQANLLRNSLWMCGKQNSSIIGAEENPIGSLIHPHVSDQLERGCESGMTFVFNLKTGVCIENRSGMTPPDPEKPRNDDDPIDPALKDVYLLDTSAMRQTNLFHGCPRRIRKTYMDAAEYQRVYAWKAAGRESPGR